MLSVLSGNFFPLIIILLLYFMIVYFFTHSKRLPLHGRVGLHFLEALKLWGWREVYDEAFLCTLFFSRYDYWRD